MKTVISLQIRNFKNATSIKCIATFLLLVIPKLVFANDPIEPKKYICIEDKATGLFYDRNKDSWDTTKFKAYVKYIISIAAKESPMATVMKFGQQKPAFFCEVDTMNCSGPEGLFMFNPENLRYLRSYMQGYINGADNNEHTPHVAIGTCSSL
jgi:hypothetical protein